MAGYAIHTPLLLGLGLKELSMNPQSIPGVKQMIRSIELKSTRSLVDEALEMKSAEKVYQLLRKKYSSIVDKINQAENGPKSNHASG
jgi:phosphotransferase system enzyme I (PtsI)